MSVLCYPFLRQSMVTKRLSLCWMTKNIAVENPQSTEADRHDKEGRKVTKHSGYHRHNRCKQDEDQYTNKVFERSLETHRKSLPTANLLICYELVCKHKRDVDRHRSDGNNNKHHKDKTKNRNGTYLRGASSLESLEFRSMFVFSVCRLVSWRCHNISAVFN